MTNQSNDTFNTTLDKWHGLDEHTKPIFAKMLDEVKEIIQSINFTFVLQDDSRFTELVKQYHPKIEDPFYEESDVWMLLHAYLMIEGIYVSERIDGHFEYSWNKAAYNQDGRMIRSNHENYFRNDDIYFNTDEQFYEYQKSVLVIQSMEQLEDLD